MTQKFRKILELFIDNCVIIPDQTFKMAERVWRQGGVRGMGQGFSATLVRNCPTYGVFFASHEWFLQYFTGMGMGLFAHLAAGGLAGSVSWLACFPADVIKTRMQSDALRMSERLNKISKSENNLR